MFNCESKGTLLFEARSHFVNRGTILIQAAAHAHIKFKRLENFGHFRIQCGLHSASLILHRLINVGKVSMIFNSKGIARIDVHDVILNSGFIHIESPQGLAQLLQEVILQNDGVIYLKHAIWTQKAPILGEGCFRLAESASI